MGSLLLFVTLPFFISVLIAALVKPVRELNVYALCSVTLLALGCHHHFKEMCLSFFVVRPDLSLTVADGSDLA